MHPKEISGGGFCRCESTEQLRNILSVGLQLYLDLLKMPDIPYILLDRTIEEYVRDIWHLKKIKVELK